jgi:hypothetical protein
MEKSLIICLQAVTFIWLENNFYNYGRIPEKLIKVETN